MLKPSITVLLSLYNGERYISEQIDSILLQESVEVNIVVRDDGSPDRCSSEIVKEYQSKYPDKVILIEGENKGFAESFSDLIDFANEHSKSEYFAFSDQDDVWMPNKLITAIKKLDIYDSNYPNCYFSNTLLVDSNLMVKGKGRESIPIINKYRSLVQNFATGCTMVFNRKAVELYASHRPQKMYVHDYWMFLICIFLGNIYYDHTPYIKYRQHSNNQIGVKNLKERYLRRFKRVFDNNNKHFFEIHDTMFLTSFNSELNEADKEILKIVANYRHANFGKIKLLLSKVRYDSKEFNFFMRLKILLGWL